MTTQKPKRQPTAADYVLRLHRNALDYHTAKIAWPEFGTRNVAIWDEIAKRPALERRVLAMLRTVSVTPVERAS